MAKHKVKTKLFIVLVDSHRSSNHYANIVRGSGRWCVCARDEKDAERVLAEHIGKTHGSIRCYYEIAEGTEEYNRYKHLVQNQCEKIV